MMREEPGKYWGTQDNQERYPGSAASPAAPPVAPLRRLRTDPHYTTTAPVVAR
jgi:hypothetical protein